MPRLVTQAVSDQPIIALIGAASPLRLSLQSFFERHSFVVQTFSFAELEKQPHHDITFYKVVVINGWEKKSNLELDVDRVVEALIKVANQTQTIFFIHEHSSLTLNQQAFNQKNLRYQLETKLPQSNVILIQDGLLDIASSLWWQIMVAEVIQSIIVDPKIPLYPVSQSAVTTAIQQILVKPQSQLRILLRGKEQLSTVVASEINRQYQLYHRRTLVLKQQPISDLDTTIEQYYQIKQLPIEPLPTLLQSWIQALPGSEDQTKSELPQPIKKPVLKPKPVVRATELPPSANLNAKVVRSAIPKIYIPQIVKPNSSSLNTKTKNSEPPKPVLSKPKVEPSIAIDEQLYSLFSSRRTEQKVSIIQEKVSTNKKITKKNKKKGVLFLGGLAFAGAALGVMALTAVFLFNHSMLQKAVLAQLKDPEKGVSPVLINSRSTLQLQTEAYELFLPAPFFDSAHELLSLTEEWQSTQNHLKELEKAQTTIVQVVLGNQPLLEIPSTSQTAFEELSRLFSRLSAQAKESTDKDEQLAVEDYVSYLENKRSSFLTYQQLSPLLPQLLGQQSKRSYAILLQNEQELRATGGFLQAVAVVTLDNGQLIDTQVFSVYDLDQKLAAAVTPPEDLKQVLGEQRWYLRDSNWNPDFPSSAKQITWFLEQQLNKKVDGVVALNIGVVQDLLRTLGPLELDQYNELLTDKNLQERIEFHSEVKLVESDKKVDYTAAVLEAFLIKLAQLPPDKTTDFLDTVGQQLVEKNMVLSLNNSNEQATFSLLGWTGELAQPNCPAQLAADTCIVDTIAVIDSNIGINKANFHLKRDEHHSITLSPTQAQHKHSITLQNTSTSNAWPKGTYKSYLRVILNPNAVLSRITINNQLLSAKDISISTVAGFTAVGFLTTTPIQEKSDIVVEYSVPHTLESGNSYTFFAQKQIGIEQPLSSIAVNLGDTFKPSIIAPQADVENGTILFSDLPVGHVFIGVSVK